MKEQKRETEVKQLFLLTIHIYIYSLISSRDKMYKAVTLKYKRNNIYKYILFYISQWYKNVEQANIYW